MNFIYCPIRLLLLSLRFGCVFQELLHCAPASQPAKLKKEVSAALENKTAGWLALVSICLGAPLTSKPKLGA